MSKIITILRNKWYPYKFILINIKKYEKTYQNNGQKQNIKNITQII